ncbi:PAS domain S-box-containing protein [Arcticibacter tournemirensis]|uniref:histidine kinase n=1 Tax=Arcticibacter tournemirensis TaxID=699437 RepID=A0A5M9HAZ4_9SPHI|nr:PAS domain S-box protein [Arcticibacter tournemirensis]KAA8484116.1 PAS domain S-box protein [Arcticibacter tournemirensis]TQM51856.1 PAS domain S-box-containing protein [Arcticibacter tournemirensis]
MTNEIENQHNMNLLMQVPSPIAVVQGPDHLFQMANFKFLELTGKQDIVGRKANEIFQGPDGIPFLELLGNVYATGNRSSANEMYFTFDCNQVDAVETVMNIVVQPCKVIKNVVDEVLIFAVDVTGQVLARKKLELAHQEITRLFNTVNEGFYSRDVLRNEYIHLSVGCQKIYGYSISDFFNNSRLWFEVIHPDDRWIVLKDDVLLNEGKQTISEYRIIRSDGSIRWIEIKVVPFIAEGVLTRVEGIVNDITERKHAQLAVEKEKELSKSIINSLPGIFYCLSDEGYFLYWNKNLELISGYTSEEISRIHFLDMVCENDRSSVLAKVEEIFEVGSGETETCLLTKSAAQIPYYFNGKAASFAGKACIFGMGLDITERKRAEEERSKMTSDLVQRNMELKQFSYIISHNLRSPIAKILGLTSLFEHEVNGNEFNQQLIKYICDEATNLDNVVRDLNTILSNGDQGIKAKKEEIIFSVELELIKQVLDKEIADSQAVITFDFTGNERIESVRSFIYSIMFNLLSNAIKYRSEKRQLTIHLSTCVSGSNLCLSVKDNGMGIDLEKYGDQVFGLYNRFHSQGIPGKGMGLNLVKTQAESLGGWVQIESQPDVGSTFAVYIPKN